MSLDTQYEPNKRCIVYEYETWWHVIPYFVASGIVLYMGTAVKKL